MLLAMAVGGLAVEQVTAQDAPPVVSGVGFGSLSQLASGDTHGLGDTIEVVVEFSEPVEVTGSPQLELTIGSATRTAELDHIWDDQTGLGFHYRVQADDLDTDGISIAADALKLDGATIQDSGGSDAELDLGEHAIINDGNHKVDGSIDNPPTVEWTGFDSSPASGDTYGVGEPIAIVVQFNEPVEVSGTPRLELTIGIAVRSMQLEDVWDDDRGLVFRYQVQAEDRDDNGISVAADALKLDGATIQDSGGNDAELDLGEHAISNDGDHKVDGSIDNPPVVVTLLCCGDRPQSGDTYGRGETLKAEVMFSEAVTVTGTPQLTLTIGSATRTVDLDYVWDDGEGLVFEYEVQSDDLDTDGISIAADALSLNGATIQDSAGNPADLDLSEHVISNEINDGNHKVDGSIDHPPVVEWAGVDSEPQSGDTYAVGEEITIDVNFTELVTVTGTPQLELTIGTATRTVDMNDRWLDEMDRGIGFTYQVQAEDRDNDGISVAADALKLNGATIQDSAGSDAELGLGEHAISNNGDHKVDGSIDHPPFVIGADFDSRPSGDTYGIGERVEIHVSFSEPVTVTGTPQLELTIGSATRTVDLEHTCCDDTVLIFRYEVQASDRDSDGISVAADALKLNGATIQDSAGSDAELDLGEHAISNDGNHKVDGSIDNPPVVEWAGFHSEPGIGDTYGIGEEVRIGINYNEPVVVSGSPQLEMNIGTVTRTVDLDHWSDEGPRFHYVVQADDLDRDGISIAADALKLNGATIKDRGGNDAVLDLGEHAFTNDAGHKLDGSIDRPPIVEGVCCLPEPQSGDTFSLGETIEIHVAFTEAVTVTGTPQVMLTLSDTERRAMDFDHTCCGSRVLIFYHEVQSSDRSPDGLSVSADALILNGGTIQDAGGKDAVLDLGEHEYAAPDPRRKVDGSIVTAPKVRDIYFADHRRPRSGDTYEIGERIEVHVEFDKAVTFTGTPQLALTVGTQTRQMICDFLWSDRWLFCQYSVQAEDRDEDGISVAADSLVLNGGTIKFAGDGVTDAELAHDALADDATRKVDGSIDSPPTVAGVAIESSPGSGDSYARGETIRIAVWFSEPVAFIGVPQLELTIGATARFVPRGNTWTQSAINFWYEVQESDLDADGISIGTGALRVTEGVSIRDATGNDAVLDLGSHAFSNDAEHKVDGGVSDAIGPAVDWLVPSPRPQNGVTYVRGESLTVVVAFDEPVVVEGSPELMLTIGDQTAPAAYGGTWLGSEPTWAFFEYVVQAEDSDADGISIAADALRLNGGTIRDRSGNDADLNLDDHAVTNLASAQVDGSGRDETAPRATRVYIDSRPSSGGDTYGRDETIELRVDFSEPVTVTGAPQLALEIGSERRTAEFAGARGVWTFYRYVVQDQDRDADGISIPVDALTLNGASIRDAAGNDAATAIGSDQFMDTRNTRDDLSGHKVDGSLQVAPPVVLGCKQPDVAVGRVVARGSQGVVAPGEELLLELEENRDGRETPVALGCVALEGQYIYSISAGNDHSAFLIGAADAMLSYVGSGEDAERTPQHLLTVAAAPQDGGEAIAIGVRIAIVNVDDPGVVTLSTMEPSLGEALKAQLEDQDTGVRDQRWQWRRKAPDGPWTAIAGATAASYTPVGADVGNYLQARVTYADEHGNQQAESEQTHAVDLAPSRRARMLELALTGFGRSVATSAVDLISQRFTQAASSAVAPDRMATNLTLNRRSLPVLAPGDAAAHGRLVRSVTEALGVRVTADGAIDFDPVSGAQLLSESAFSMERSHGGGRWGLWGSGDVSGFSRDIDGFKQDATVISGYLGVDYRFVPNALAGLAASYSNLDLTSESEVEGKATLTGYLINAYPYGFWMPEAWLGLWGLAGFGTGEAELVDLGVTLEGDLRMWLGAMGQRVELLSAGGLSLAVKSDGFITGLTSGGELPQVDANAWRARLLLEGGLEWRPGDSRLAASVELGGRLDGGDAEQGLGVEGGAALSYTHTGSGLGITGRGRLLLVHEDAELRDWGASAILSWAPPGLGSGLAVSLAPVWGEPTSGVNALWQNRELVLAGSAGASSVERASWLPDAADLKVSYGLSLLHGAGRVTPFAEIQFENTAARRLRAGATVELSAPEAARRLHLEAFGERAAGGDAETYQFGIGGSVEY